MAATEALVFDAIRTPRGKGKVNGSLHATKPVDLVVGLMHETLSRHGQLDPNRVDDVVLGCVSPIGDQGADIAKTAAIKAGLPDTVAGVQLNRFCASGLEAVNIAAQKVASGWEDLVFAGGVESMSRVPMGSDGGAWAMDPETNYDTGFVPQGISADLIATIEELQPRGRRRLRRALAGARRRRAGRGPLRQVGRPGDGHQRQRASSTTTSSSAPAPRSRRSGSSSRRSRRWARWAASTPSPCRSTTGSRRSTTSTRRQLVGHRRRCLTGGDRQRADRRRASASSRARGSSRPRSRGADPTIMLTGPAPASRKALAKAGLTVEDMDLVEINEAFAAVVLRFVKDMGLDLEKVNVNGGAIAMGHPLGATGGDDPRHADRRARAPRPRYGLATLCVGGGMGIATVIERLSVRPNEIDETTTMSESTTIRWDKDDDGIVILTLDDPNQSANTMNAAYEASMAATVDRLEAEKDDIAGVIITSAKKTFFAGGDLNDLQAGRRASTAARSPRGCARSRRQLRRAGDARQAGRRGDQRRRARRRPGDRAGLPPPDRRRRPEGRSSAFRRSSSDCCRAPAASSRTRADARHRRAR